MTIFFAMVPDAGGAPQPAFFLRQSQAPEGAVAISERRHAQLVEALADGQTVTAGRDGKPRVAARRPDAAAQRAQLVAAIKREAARRIDQVSPIWRQLNDTRAPSPEGARRFAQIDAIRDASDAIEALLADVGARDLGAFPVSDNPAWPEFD
jgi:hypothetical protein